MVNKVAIVGGVPDPIGGVTSFIKRVVAKERAVRWLFDLYPSSNKRVPVEFEGRFYCNKIKFLTVLRLWFFCLVGRADVIHFNFSTPRSLILLLVLPKCNVRWALTLHHGYLDAEVDFWVRWVLSRKVDFALALNDRQSKWYVNFIPENKVVHSSSYVLPREAVPSLEVLSFLESVRSRFRHIFVCSGYPTSIYNHLLAIQLMQGRNDSVLLCCLYGEGSLLDEIKIRAQEAGNVIILEFLEEGDFNYLLSRSDMYLRLNTEDSFGIAVADAVNFGVKVVATDVCARYPGACLVSVDENVISLSSVIDRELEEKSFLSDGVNEFKFFSYDSFL